MINPTILGKAIVTVATNFVGMVEVKSNKEWDDPLTAFQDIGKDAWLNTWQAKITGWDPGAPYCSAFAGAVVAFVLFELGYSHPLQVWRNKFCAHIMTNVRTFKAAECLSPRPEEGGIWFAQHGDTDKGHGGIVIANNTSGMTTVEANTSQGKTASTEGQRNGDGIWIRTQSQKGRGALVTRGFLNPTAILNLVGLPNR